MSLKAITLFTLIMELNILNEPDVVVELLINYIHSYIQGGTDALNLTVDNSANILGSPQTQLNPRQMLQFLDSFNRLYLAYRSPAPYERFHNVTREVKLCDNPISLLSTQRLEYENEVYVQFRFLQRIIFSKYLINSLDQSEE